MQLVCITFDDWSKRIIYLRSSALRAEATAITDDYADEGRFMRTNNYRLTLSLYHDSPRVIDSKFSNDVRQGSLTKLQLLEIQKSIKAQP